MDFGGLLLVVCGLIVLVAAVGMCAKCRRGRSGGVDFGTTPGTVNTKGSENTVVVVDND